MSAQNAGLGRRYMETMQTAPEDGTQVLVWNKGCGFWIASWRLPARGEPQSESHYEYEWRDECGRWATPTHWTPLPTAPSDAEFSEQVPAAGRLE